MEKYSEWIHKEFQTNGFEFSNNIDNDVIRYRKFKKIPITIDKEINEAVSKTIIFRLSFGESFTVNTLTDGVVEKIKHIEIKNMPRKLPEFLKKSFLIEARHDKALLDNIRSIGGFIVGGEIYLIIVTDQGRLYSQKISSSFDGRKIEELNMVYRYENEYATYESVRMKERKDVFAFALIFALMMEAKKTPFIVETKSGKKHSGNNPKPSKNDGWIEKRIYIDRDIKYKRTGKKYGELDKDGKHLKDISVHGFLRLQRFGKDLSESQWIYIDDYDSKRWTNERDIKITVDIFDKDSKTDA